MESNSIGRKIAKLRKENNLTQKQLADLIHVTDKAVSRWESGIGNPEISLLPEIANVFDVSVDFLLSSSIEEYEEPKIKNNKYKYIFLWSTILIEFLIIVCLGIGLILTSCHKQKNTTEITRTPYITDVSILLDKNDRASSIGYELLSNKTYYCNLYTDGNASVADFNISSSISEILFGEIQYSYDNIFYTYFYVGDYNGVFTISFNCGQSTFTKTLNAFYGDISTNAFVDTNLSNNFDAIPFIAEDKSSFDSYIENNPFLKPFVCNLENDFSINIVFFSYILISPSNQKFFYNSSFVFNSKLYIDFYAKMIYGDPQFDSSGVHLSIIQLGREYLSYIPFNIHFSVVEGL